MFHKKERQEDTMVKSMTGFGRYELTEDDRKFTIEMKSVNHKFLDVNMKMPKKLSMFEGDMRNVLKKYAVRGKIDIFISYEDMSVTNTNLKFNRNLAEEYLKYFKEMEEELGLKKGNWMKKQYGSCWNRYWKKPVRCLSGQEKRKGRI